MKKGYLMTLEAIIAVVIIFLFIYSVMNINQRGISKEENVKEKMDFILKGISLNEEYRECIVKGQIDDTEKECEKQIGEEFVKAGIRGFIEETLPDVYDYKLCIGNCNVGVEKNIYVSSIFVSAVLDLKDKNKLYKEVYLYVWEE